MHNMINYMYYEIFDYSHARTSRLFKGVTADYPAYADIACFTQSDYNITLTFGTSYAQHHVELCHLKHTDTFLWNFKEQGVMI